MALPLVRPQAQGDLAVGLSARLLGLPVLPPVATPVNTRQLGHLRDAVLRVYPEVAPGLRGHYIVMPGPPIPLRERGVTGPVHLVTTIAAVEPHTGAFGRWVESLPTDETWVFRAVVSPHADRVLRRHGFTPLVAYGSDHCLARLAR